MKQTDRGLENTHLSDVQDYLKEHADSIMRSDRPFSKYMRAVIRKKGLKQRDIFLWADIPERYGYKLISEEKRTKQRDVILRICYAAEFTLEETQRALRIYEMPQLYEKIPRDVVLMVCFGDRPGSVNDVNAVLSESPVEVSEDDIINIMSTFSGKIMQVPPMYSALKVDGRKLVDLAREGIEVERKAREIEIFELEILEVSLPLVRFRVNCSKGT